MTTTPTSASTSNGPTTVTDQSAVATRRHLDGLRAASSRLAAAARNSLDVPIPACPGWCMADLVWHTGTIMHWSGNVLSQVAGDVPTEVPPMPEAPPDQDLVPWFEQGADRLARLLSERDPEDTLGQCFPVGYGGPSLYRHYAREVEVHRWDAEEAVGSPAPIDTHLAGEWLDGILVGWLPNAAARGNQAQGRWNGQTVHFRRTDGPGEWLVRLHEAGRVESARGEGDGDVTVSGTGSALLLLALNRIKTTEPGVLAEGDLDLLERWRTEIRYGRPAAGPHWLGSPRPSARRPAYA